MPRPLLLLLKTNDCLRAVDLALGQPVNTTIITARECTRALHQLALRRAQGPWQYLQAYWRGLLDAAHVEFVMAVLSGMSWWGRVTMGSEQRRALAREEKLRRRRAAISSAEARAARGLPAEFVAA
jgi:aarF domain-containing kinase